MQSILSGLMTYAGSWKIRSVETFSKEDIALVNSAQVVNSDYGRSVCFIMKAGGKTYIPLSNQSSLRVGDRVDLEKAKVLILGREGDADILRVDA